MSVQAKLVRDGNGASVQLFTPSGVRVHNSSVTDTSTAATAMPSGVPTDRPYQVEIRASEPIYIIFGTSGVGVASAAATSQYFPAGEKVQQILQGVTHFRAIRAGATSAVLQIERLD